MKVLKRIMFAVLCCCALSLGITHQSDTQVGEVIFEGYPTHRVIVNVADKDSNYIPSKSQKMGKQESEEYKCVILKIGKDYYWKSRSKALKGSDIGIEVITFYRTNGDHIRIPNPEWVKQFDTSKGIRVVNDKGKGRYVEHINQGMSSIIYTGNVTTNKVKPQ